MLVRSNAYLAAFRKMTTVCSSNTLDYASASRDDLLARISHLEQQLSSARNLRQDPSAPLHLDDSIDAATRLRPAKAIRQAWRSNDVSAPLPPVASTSASAQQTPQSFFDGYPSRKIALRFSYEGWHYGGLAIQNEGTPLPTVEGVLLDALARARLISPRNSEDGLEGLGYSRCGRTDRGVSAAGQVVALYVRSQLREKEGTKELGWWPAKTPKGSQNPISNGSAQHDEETLDEQALKVLSKSERNDYLQRHAARSAVKLELPYMQLLNRFLPPSIRILGWSPVSPEFDARFSCSHRHYKYFFTNSRRYAPLDIPAMRDAASRLVGEHDFRNLCKIDPTKQLTNYKRRILSATIDEVDEAETASGSEEDDRLMVLNLRGSAFLYNQVRHIMAVLFLVGSGAEQPSIIDTLANTGYDESFASTSTATIPIVPSRPGYEMADDLPLVLWDCGFPADSVSWRQDAALKSAGAMWTHYTGLRVKSTISRHFLQACTLLHSEDDKRANALDDDAADARRIIQTGAGNHTNIKASRYIPLLDRPRSDLVENINRRWMETVGKRRAEKKEREASLASSDLV